MTIDDQACFENKSKPANYNEFILQCNRIWGDCCPGYDYRA